MWAECLSWQTFWKHRFSLFLWTIINHQSFFCHHTKTVWPLPSHPRQNKDNNNTMDLESRLSLQVLNISDEEPISIKQWLHSWLSWWMWRWCPGWHSSLFPRRMLSYLRWAAHIFSRLHILNSNGAEIPAGYRQQVWGQDGLSKDVKSMEDSLMSFPYLYKQRDWNAGGCLSTCRRWRRYSPLNRILITGCR